MRGHSLLEVLESPWSPCEVMDSHKFRGKDLRVPRSRSFSGNWNSSKISSASYENRKEEVCQLILDMHVQSVKWSCASRLDLSNTIHWRVLEFFFTFHEALREKKKLVFGQSDPFPSKWATNHEVSFGFKWAKNFVFLSQPETHPRGHGSIRTTL